MALKFMNNFSCSLIKYDELNREKETFRSKKL